MKRPAHMLRWVAILLIIVVFPQGNTAMAQSSGEAALLCGAGGAVAGGAIGAAASGKNSLFGALVGAAIGGLVGAATCFAIAEYKSQQTLGYQETQQAVQYRPEQGNLAQITKFTLDPSAAAPGSQVVFNATYYVMAPSDAEVTVMETRTLKKFDAASNQYKEMGRPASSVTMKPGTRNADGKFDVRSGVDPGKYLLAFKVESNGKADEKELPFEVTTNKAQLSEAKMVQVTAEPGGGKRVGGPVAAPALPTPPPMTAASPPAAAPAASSPLASLGEGQPGVQAGAPPAARPAAPPSQAAPAVAPASRAPQRYFVASKVATRGTVREGPGSGFRVIAEMEKNDRFIILQTQTPQGSQSPWHKIRLDDGREGWVNSALGSESQE
jgi:hypothetical protein